MNGDVQICLDFKNLSLKTIDLELGIVEQIAADYNQYLDAILYIFNRNAFEYNNFIGKVEFDEKAWKNARNFYQIKNAWN